MVQEVLSAESWPVTGLPSELVRAIVEIVPSATLTVIGPAGLMSAAPGAGLIVTAAAGLGGVADVVCETTSGAFSPGAPSASEQAARPSVATSVNTSPTSGRWANCPVLPAFARPGSLLMFTPISTLRTGRTLAVRPVTQITYFAGPRTLRRSDTRSNSGATTSSALLPLGD